MAMLVRTTQTAVFVCVHDPAVIKPIPPPEVWPCVDPDWLPAAGQPPDATRFEVRPLSPAEFRSCMDSGDAEEQRRIAYAGLVSVDGQPPPSLADLAYGWDRQITNLIVEITTLPTTGLASRSAAGRSAA